VSTSRIYIDYLNDILDAGEKAESFLQDVSYAEFVQNTEKVYAVIRALEIMGEAAKQIPLEIQVQASAVPWRSVAGMRDVLVHRYFGVNLKRVYETVKREVPILRIEVLQLLQKLEEEKMKKGNEPTDE
jgi:uncharacterized protein with HEPN domain